MTSALPRFFLGTHEQSRHVIGAHNMRGLCTLVQFFRSASYSWAQSAGHFRAEPPCFPPYRNLSKKTSSWISCPTHWIRTSYTPPAAFPKGKARKESSSPSNQSMKKNSPFLLYLVKTQPKYQTTNSVQVGRQK